MKKITTVVLVATIVAASCKSKQTGFSTYTVNENTSKAEWKGSAPDHFHVGAFDIKGALKISESGVVSGGELTIPIASIQDYDLQEPERKVLLDDLKSANFFNLVLYPRATFHITAVKPFSTQDTSAVPGVNYLLTGDFTMIGQTHPVNIPAKISIASNTLSAEAKFNLDRTKWGMNIYNDPTKPLYILPEVNMHLKVQATAGL